MVRTPYYQVKMEGQDITPWIGSVSVTEDDRQADSVALSIPDPRMIYADALFEGSKVEVDMGYAGANQHALMLKAIITKVEQSYPDNGLPSLSLKGEDKSILMGLAEQKMVWRNRKVSDIVHEIGRKNNYDDQHIEVQLNPDPMIQSRPINQDGKTDLAFLQELAQTYHAKCFVELNERDEEVLYFLPERRIVRLRRPETLVLQYRLGPGSNLISFSPAFDSSYIDRLKEVSDVDNQGNNIESREEPPAEIVIWKLDEARKAQASRDDKKIIDQLYEIGQERKRDLQRRLTARRPAVGDVAPDQAEIDSKNDSLESRRLGMTATGATAGNIWLRAKSNVIVEGLNNRFNGEWYVSSVTHKIDSGGYRTDFKCVR